MQNRYQKMLQNTMLPAVLDRLGSVRQCQDMLQKHCLQGGKITVLLMSNLAGLQSAKGDYETAEILDELSSVRPAVMLLY